MPYINSEALRFSPEEEVINRLKPQWVSTVEGLGGNLANVDSSFEEIVNRYKLGDGRAYHNIFHIDRMLSVVNQFIELSENPNTLRAAVFGHDIIYNPGSTYNEGESADVFGNLLSKIGASSDKIDEAKRIIMITEKHKTTDDDIDGKLMIDGDFAILGSPDNIYDTYFYGIYTENVLSGKVSLQLYKEGRGRYLGGWIKDTENNRLFLIPEIRDALQSQALKNFLREKKWLETI